MAYKKKRIYKKKKQYNKNTKVIMYKPHKEMLFNDYLFSGQAGSTGSIYLLNGIAQGDDTDDRTGKQISIKSIQLSLNIKNTTVNKAYGRLVIVLDRYVNGSLFNISDLYDTASITFNNGALRNLNNKTRFKILMDRKYRLSSLENDNQQTMVFINKYIKTSIITNYMGTTDGVASINTGGIYILWADSETTGTLLDGVVRLKYTD